MRRSLMTACAWTALTAGAFAQDLPPLNSDTETDRLDWSALESTFGAVPQPAEGTQVGGVSKTLTNEYWRALGEGYESEAEDYGVTVVYQAAQSEGDQLGQLSIAETLISQGFNALLFSPQTDANLQPAMETAKAAGIPSSTSMTRSSRRPSTTWATSSATTAFASPSGSSTTCRAAARSR